MAYGINTISNTGFINDYFGLPPIAPFGGVSPLNMMQQTMQGFSGLSGGGCQQCAGYPGMTDGMTDGMTGGFPGLMGAFSPMMGNNIGSFLGNPAGANVQQQQMIRQMLPMMMQMMQMMMQMMGGMSGMMSGMPGMDGGLQGTNGGGTPGGYGNPYGNGDPTGTGITNGGGGDNGLQGGPSVNGNNGPQGPTGANGQVNLSPHGGWQGTEGPVKELAGLTGLQVVSAKRSTRNTTSGNMSDHYIGNASAYANDLGWGKSTPTPQSDAAASKIVSALGGPANWGQKGGVFSKTINGIRYQVIYRSNVGGNHFNHIHLGAKKV